MNYFTNQRINKDLKSLVSQFKDGFRIKCDSSRNAYMKTLSPGAPMPLEGRIYGDGNRQEFESECMGYRNKAREILGDYLGDLKKKATEAPSTDAVNTISLLNMRSNITEREIDDLLTRYGDNPQAWRAINSIAIDHDIRVFKDHPVYEEISTVEDLGASLDKAISLQSAESGHASDGYIALVNAQIDGAFPTGEEA